MTHFETIHTFKTARLTIETAVAHEDFEPDWDFENEQDRDEFFRKLDNDVWAWFQVRVRVLLDHKFEVGADYLGGCCYETTEEFLHDAYWRDMVHGACSEARNYLTKYRTPLIVRAA
jgi:hypothetical protein